MELGDEEWEFGKQNTARRFVEIDEAGQTGSRAGPSRPSSTWSSSATGDRNSCWRAPTARRRV
jgi:hypothetical protein